MSKNKLLKQGGAKRKWIGKNLLSRVDKPSSADSRRFLRNFVITIVFWIIGFLTIPDLLILPRTGLDYSWRVGLVMAITSGLQFGKDIVFTLGPLGFMFQPVFGEFNTGLISAIFNLFAHFLLIQTIVFVMKKLSAGLLDCVLIGITLMFALPVTFIEYKLLFVVTILLYFSIVNQTSTKRLLILCVFVSFLMAAVSLIKFTAMLISAGVLTFMVIFYLYKKQMLPLCCMLFSYIVSLLVLLFAAGQKISSFPAYVLNSAEISQGYNSAMYFDGPWKDIFVGFFAIGLLIFLLVNSIVKKRPGLIYFILINAGFVFVSFKHGFIRHDDHVYLFFANMLLVFSIIWITNKKQFTLPLHCLSIILMCVLMGFIFRGNQRLIIPDIPEKFSMVRFTVFVVTNDVVSNTRILEDRKRRMRKFCSLSNGTLRYIANKSIDIMPMEISLAYAYNLKWSPRPVFQCYSAYTDKLDMLNSQYFEGVNAPDILLYELYPVDKRYPLFDSPAAFRTILKRYEPVFLDNQYIVLRKTDTYSPPPSKVISVLDTEIGSPIPVPRIRDGYLFANIDMDYNLLGKIAKLFYKVPGVKIKLVGNGGESENRFIFSSARNGIFLSQYVLDVRELLDVWQGKMDDRYDLDSITITADSPYFYGKNIRVEFFVVPL
ncbi:MAG: hypothetical protein WC454_03520 [Phycisphaerae bacterium]|jgi:hypothetical protein